LLEELVIDSDEQVSQMSAALAKMLNVKKVLMLEKGKSVGEGFAVKDFGKGKVYLKVSASPELKDTWELSELLRAVQDARKKAGLTPGEKVTLEIECDYKSFLEKNKQKIEEKTSSMIKIVSGKKLEKLVETSFWFDIKR
jgi:hypothetical protein